MIASSRSFRANDLGVDFVPRNGEHLDLRNVWESNLEEEMYRLMKAAELYPYIAMVHINLYCYYVGYGVSWSMLPWK